MLGIRGLSYVTEYVLQKLWPSTSAFDISVRTIRYYTFMGLLTKPEKYGNELLYSALHVRQIVFIKGLQASGYNLVAVKRILAEKSASEIAKEMSIRLDDIDPMLAEAEELFRNENATIATLNEANEQGERKAYLALLDDKVKISSSKNPAKRAKESLARLACTLAGGRDVEIELRKRFEADHLEGDWFAYSPAIRQFVEGHSLPNASEEQQRESLTMSTESKIQTVVTEAQAYAKLRDKVRLGDAFAFLCDLDDEMSKIVYKLLYGQKSKGKLEKAVLFVDEDGLDLPGCTLKGRATESDMTIIVPDKDVYREADDVAQLFVFNQAAPKSSVSLTVSVDGAVLDTLAVRLDENGCGIVRYATVASGNYSVAVTGSKAKCSFEVAKYALAPLTTTVKRFSKRESSLSVSLRAETFGQPFSGQVSVAVLADGNLAQEHEIAFADGTAEITFDASGLDGALALRISSKEDPDLVANAPLRGSSRKDREDTIVSRLGKVFVSSLVGEKGAKEERGLFFSEDAKNSSPIVLNSCVSKSIDLDFSEDAEMVTVAIREPASKEVRVEELGAVKKGQAKKLRFTSAFAAVHVGAFVKGKPWEGHAVVVQPVSNKVSVSAPKRIEPGETIDIAIRSKSKASVLVRIADKRMRVQTDARTAIASRVKAMIEEMVGTASTGEAKARLQTYHLGHPGFQDGVRWQAMPAMANIGAQRARGGQIRYAFGGGGGTTMGAVHGMGMGMGMGTGGNMGMLRAAAPVDEQLRVNMLVDQNAGITANVMHDDTRQASLMLNEDRFAIASSDQFAIGSSGDPYSAVADSLLLSAMALAKSANEAIVREMQVDLVYCGLVEVNGERKLSVRMPDCVGLYDVTVFAVSGRDWQEAKHDLVVEKDAYLEPLIPQYAHPEDGIKAVAVAVRPPNGAKYAVRIDGKDVPFALDGNDNIRLSWAAVPGLHEVTMSVNGKAVDRVARVVEAPGEEVVIGQELRILKPGEKYDLSSEEDVLSVKVVPGMDGELRVAVSLCADFQHYCCEQTSAVVSGACVAAFVGNDSDKQKAYESIIKGAARLRSMFAKGKGFASYPGSNVVEEWSAAAARRTARLAAPETAPADVVAEIKAMNEMGDDALKAHGDKAYAHEGKMEALYYGRSKGQISAKDIADVVAALGNSNAWEHQSKSEGAFCAARLVRDGKLEDAISVANAVSKAMAGALGGAMHGSCEAVAYMTMVHELQKSGVVAGAGSGHAKINGREMPMDKAVAAKDIASVEATKTACAIKLTRLNRMRFDEANSGVEMSIKVEAKDGRKQLKPGEQAKLVVKIEGGYKSGDVLCVALPDCLSKIVGGTKAKKFQIDFAGKDKLEVNLVAGRKTGRPQRWAAVVRNMYDGARIGSAGLLSAEVV